MSTVTENSHSKFHHLLHNQIHHEFTAEHQYLAIAIWADNADLPQLAKFFYAQATEEHSHALMMVRYFLDRDIAVELAGIEPVKSHFDNVREPIALAWDQEKTVTEQVVQLANTAREEGDYLGEQFMQWFLREQIEEEARMKTLLTVAERASGNLFDLETFVARDMSTSGSTPGAPPVAGAV